MKPFFKLLFFVGFILTGCSEDTSLIPNRTDIRTSRPQEEQTIVNCITAKYNLTRGEDISLLPIIMGEDTVLYVYNHPSGGFEVFAKDKTLPMSLVKSKRGYISPMELDDLTKSDFNNPVISYISSLGKAIQSWKASNKMPLEEDSSWKLFESLVEKQLTRGNSLKHIGIAVEGTTTDHYPIGGRLQTKWRQGSPYNNYAPFCDTDPTLHCPIGCGTVAVGQYLYFTHKYFGVPRYTKAKGEYNSQREWYYFTGETDRLWTLIDDGSPNFLNNSDRIEATSIFLGSIASAIGGKMGPFTPTNGIGTSNNSIQSYINQQIDTNKTIVEFSIKDLLSVLDSGYPVVAMGEGILSRDDKEFVLGHTFLIDYAQSIKLHFYDIYIDPAFSEYDPSLEEPETGDYGPDIEYYRTLYGSSIISSFSHSETNCWVSMNWGFGGWYDEVLFNCFPLEWCLIDKTETLTLNKINILK